MKSVINIITGDAKRIDDYDLPRVGHIIGVGEDEVHALIDVESNGRPFDSQGRVTMLYEKHIFNRRLPEHRRVLARQKGLARTRWVRDYPSDSYPIFLKAAKFNRKAAFESCSWGIGQIMGFNYASCGYNSAEEMVDAFSDDEDKQLEAMIMFVKNNGIAEALKNHDWHTVARKYNGAGYKRNNYHVRLKAAYDWWSNKPDTPWTPESSMKEDKTSISFFNNLFSM